MDTMGIPDIIDAPVIIMDILDIIDVPRGLTGSTRLSPAKHSF